MSFEPTIFGRYALLRRIAIGGMAEVFRAMAYGVAGFEKLVAIKRLLPHMTRDQQFVDMFINEAKLAALLSHGNIVQIHDFGSIQGQLYLAMEYVHGQDLSRLIARLRRDGFAAPIELSCFVLVQVLEALQYAHRARTLDGREMTLVHRDISPPNVIVSYTGEVKLADFGIAKVLRETSNTGSGVLKGKFGYMSPEQVGGGSLDHRSDLFSLGACFYELLTRQPAFGGDSEMEILSRIRRAEFTPPRRLDSSVPRRLDQIVAKALAREPEQRFQSAAEFRDAVERFLIDKNYHYSAAWLADFMQEVFAEEKERHKRQLDREAELAERLRPSPERLAEIEAEMEQEVETLIHQRPEFLARQVPELDQGPAEDFDDEDDDEASTVMVSSEELQQLHGAAREEPAVETAAQQPPAELEISGRFTQPTARRERPQTPEPAPEPQPSSDPASREQEWFESLAAESAPVSGAEPDADPAGLLVDGQQVMPLHSVADLPSGTVADIEAEGGGRRRRGLTWLAVFLVLVAAAGVWLLSSGPRQSDRLPAVASRTDGGSGPGAQAGATSGSAVDAGALPEPGEPGPALVGTVDAGVSGAADSGPRAAAASGDAGVDAGRGDEAAVARLAGAAGVKAGADQADAGTATPTADSGRKRPAVGSKKSTGSSSKSRRAVRKSAKSKKRRWARRSGKPGRRRYIKGRVPSNLKGPPYLYVDGRRVRTTAELSRRLSKGRHTLELRDRRGRVVRRWRVSVSTRR